MRRLAPALLGAVNTLATAATLSVSPPGVTIDEGQRAAALQVSNLSNAPVVIQMRLQRWEQRSGIDQFSEAADLTLSPPYARIPPGEKQTLRVLSRRPPEGTETAYRLWIDEVPQGVASGQRVVFRTRIDMPLFVVPASAKPRPRFKWRKDGNELIVLAENAGNSHLRIHGFEIEYQDGSRQSHNVLKYALAGQRTEMRLVLRPGAMPLIVEAMTNSGRAAVDGPPT